MPGATQLTEAQRKEAEKAYDAEVEAEVRRRIEQEKKNKMDSAEAARAAEAAKTTADELRARLESDLKAEREARAALTKRLEAMEACAQEQKQRDEAAKTAADARVLERARILAAARVPKARVEAEAARLAKLGAEAVDELLAATPAPSGDPTILALARGEAADDKPDHIRAFVARGEDGDTGEVGYMVSDWNHYAPKKGVTA